MESYVHFISKNPENAKLNYYKQIIMGIIRIPLFIFQILLYSFNRWSQQLIVGHN